LGSILAASLAGSNTDTIAGANIEHVFLGSSFCMAVMLLLNAGNFRHIDGLRAVSKYLFLFGVAVFLGFLSSIQPGPRVIGAHTLIYWCGLITSVGVAALAALLGHTRWVLAAVALGGLPLIASVLQPFFPFLAKVVPAARVQDWYMGRATGFFANPNNTGFALYCGLAGCLCLFHCIQHRFVRWACLGAALLYTGSIFFTVSRASILVAFLTMFAFAYAIWRRAKYRRTIVVVLVILAGTALQRASADVDWSKLSFARIFDKSVYEGDSFRFHAIYAVMSRPGRTLLLGEGMGQFVEMSHIYLKGISLAKIDIYDKAPHNQILHIWVEWGFLALVLMYAAHAWVIMHGAAKVRRCADAAGLMLLTTYLCILLYLQLHGVGSPASCALLGLFAGQTFAHDELAADRLA